MGDKVKVIAVSVLLVLVLMASVSTLLRLPWPKQTGERSKRASAMSQLAVLGRILDLFKEDVGRFPTHTEGLNALYERPTDADNWKGPYVSKRIAFDPWNNPYRYKLDQSKDGPRFTLTSFGADGKPGGEDEDMDIVVKSETNDSKE